MTEERETITVDLDEDLLWKLFMEAHRRDMTLNRLIEEYLIRYMQEQHGDIGQGQSQGT